MDGRQGAELVAMLALPKAIPVHLDDYAVFASPLADLPGDAAARPGDRIVAVDRAPR